MKRERDAMAEELSKLIFEVHTKIPEYDTSSIESAFYNVCEAERVWESWTQEVVSESNRLADYIVTCVFTPAAFGTIEDMAKFLIDTITGERERVRLPSSRGPYR